MKIVTAPETLVSLLAPLEKETTLLDRAGKVLGTFLPAALFDDALKAQIKDTESEEVALQVKTLDGQDRADS